MARNTILMMTAACLCFGLSLSRPDLNELNAVADEFEDVLNSNNEIEPDSIVQAVVKRNVPPCNGTYGCIEEANITDPVIKGKFEEAWAIMPHSDRYKDVELVYATEQVVAGMRYTFNATAATKRNSGCLVIPIKCYLDYYVKPGDVKGELLHHECDSYDTN